MRKRFILPETLINEQNGELMKQLEQQGDIVNLFDPSQSRPSIFDDARLTQCIYSRLKEIKFDPDNDIIVLRGSLNLIVRVCVAASSDNPIKCMMYNHHANCLVECSVS